jgi:hypothetical protein
MHFGIRTTAYTSTHHLPNVASKESIVTENDTALHVQTRHGCLQPCSCLGMSCSACMVTADDRSAAAAAAAGGLAAAAGCWCCCIVGLQKSLQGQAHDIIVSLSNHFSTLQLI